MRTPSVLLVDDDTIVLRLFARVLGTAGYDVTACESGEAALQVCRARRPDLAILDHEMPGMTGIEVAQTLRDVHEVPFVFVSAHAETEVIDAAVQCGALSYLLKPLEPVELTTHVGTLLNLTRQQRKLHGSLESAREVSTAVGILMVTERLTRQRARERFQLVTRSRKAKAIETARRIIAAYDAVASAKAAFAAESVPLESKKQ